jgi:hypothetical protein
MHLRVLPWLRFECLLLSCRLVYHWGCLQRMAPMHANCMGHNPQLGPCSWVFLMWNLHWVMVSSTQRYCINCVTFSSYILLELTSGKFNTDWLKNCQWKYCLYTWQPLRLISRVGSIRVCLWYLIWMIFILFSFTTYCGDSCCLYSSTGKSLWSFILSCEGSGQCWWFSMDKLESDPRPCSLSYKFLQGSGNWVCYQPSQ